MKYTVKDFETNFTQFATTRKEMSDYSIEIVNDVNPLNPVLMLRMYEQDASVDNLVSLASQMLAKKEVRFFFKEREITRFIYDGVSDFGNCFKDFPFLLDPCLKYCYSILLKKLAAPSGGIASESKQSE